MTPPRDILAALIETQLVHGIDETAKALLESGCHRHEACAGGGGVDTFVEFLAELRNPGHCRD